MRHFRLLALALFALPLLATPAAAYIEIPMSLGAVIQQSTCVCSMVVTKVDKTQNLIIFEKVADLKGKHPQQTIKHNIGKGGLRPGEWKEIMDWAEVGKPAIFFHNGGSSETFIGVTWYQAYPNGEWWGMSHGEPFLLRSFSGKQDKLAQAVKDIVDGKETIVPCMVDGDKEALHKKTAKIQRLKASLKLQDYNPKRDFVGWGGEDIRRLAGFPGFDRYASLGRSEADAQSVTSLDIDGDGKPDICLASANKVTLLISGDDGFSEVSLPGLSGGCRSAVWADYNGDGLPDLLLATPTGPKLYTNMGKGIFKDTTSMLPVEAAYNLTAAAWGDFDGDGKPDILLANGFHGLRLYRNKRSDAAIQKVPDFKLTPWHAIGPFRQGMDGTKNFDTKFSPEANPGKIDLAMKHKGKRDTEVVWTKKEYAEATIINLAEYGANCAIYLHREIEVPAAIEIPASFGSDDTLTVWVNGVQIIAKNGVRLCAADQHLVKLKLNAGKNTILMKVCNFDQEFAFYFAAGQSGPSVSGSFVDESAAWGLGENGIASTLKGDSLSVADFDNDGKLDFLYGAGTGLMVKNVGGKFQIVADSGIAYKTGKVGPALCDFNGDGLVDLFVPQMDGSCKLFQNAGNGKFTDVSAKSGDLAKPLGMAVGAAWGDFDNDGKPDLLVTCLRGTNKYFKNNGDGTFTDKSADIGLAQKVYNTQAAAWADLNNDGRLDLILNNEGQDSAVLFGRPAEAAKWTPVVVRLPAASGGTVTVRTPDGKTVASSQLFGGDGRGGQAGLVPRFALQPGDYKITLLGSDGKTREKPVKVEANPMSVKLE